MKQRPAWLWGGMVCVAAMISSGCGLLGPGQTASLGGTVAGERGDVRVVFINNTSFRAVLTAGTYDPSDRTSQPDIVQFGPAEPDIILDGDSTSGIGTLTCARTFAIGSPTLLDLIADNLSAEGLVEEATITGVEFFEIPAEDGDEADAEPTSQGFAPPFEARLGTDFPCGALLIIRLEIDDQGSDPFRIAFEMVPAESTR